MMRLSALPLALALAAAPALAPAAAQEPLAIAPRYVFVPVKAGALRLHTGTGEVSLCTGADGAGSCNPLPDAARDPGHIGRLEERLAGLEARIAALEADAPAAALSDEESMDRVMVLADRMMRRFVRMVRDMKEDVESGEL